MASSPLPARPRQIARYRVDDCLGRGAMGVVWRGHDPLLDRLVAIKVLSPPSDLEPERRAEYQERFAREARAAGRLVHPNIVPIYDMGTHEGDPYLVLEYVEGGSLASLLKASGPFEPSKTCPVRTPMRSARSWPATTASACASSLTMLATRSCRSRTRLTHL